MWGGKGAKERERRKGEGQHSRAIHDLFMMHGHGQRFAGQRRRGNAGENLF